MIRYFGAWLGMIVIAVMNGSLRQFVFLKQMSEPRAHQLSTVTLILVFAFYIWLVDRLWPFPSPRTAIVVGVIWLILTIAFEFGLGRATGKPWSVLLADYNLLAGRLWALVPLGVAIAPWLMWRLRTR
jgi:hypothetical protein